MLPRRHGLFIKGARSRVAAIPGGQEQGKRLLVKIDRGFVSGAAPEDSELAIVSAIVGIARSLRLRVVAEGVETTEQFAILRRKECDEAQGFYFSHPMAADEVVRLLTAAPVIVRQPRLSV